MEIPHLSIIHRFSPLLIWGFPEIGVPPNHPNFSGIFHYKPAIFGYPHLWTPPYRIHHHLVSHSILPASNQTWSHPPPAVRGCFFFPGIGQLPFSGILHVFFKLLEGREHDFIICHSYFIHIKYVSSLNLAFDESIWIWFPMVPKLISGLMGPSNTVLLVKIGLGRFGIPSTIIYLL